MLDYAPLLRMKPPGRRVAGVRFAAFLLCTACLLGSVSPAAAEQEDTTDQPDIADEPVWTLDSPIGPFEYRAGRGLRVGRTGLNIGGFSTLEIEREESESGSLSLEGINFLVLFQPIEKIRAFMELEVGNLFRVDMGDGTVESDPVANFQRLYGDVSASDTLNARLGKFQTPVGRWNLVPAEPFVWTTTEPVVVNRAFDEHQTGGMLFGSFYPGSEVLSYWLYGQFVDPFDVESDESPADRGVGGRLEYSSTLAPWSAGTSFLASERDGQWSYLGGLDGVWATGPLELTAVFTLEGGDLEDRDLWDVYLQGVYEVCRSFYLVARYEHFDPRGPEPASNIGDVGIAWLPRPYINFKAGYRFADRETDDVTRGLKVALAFLF
jgi:hypothetical protein